MRRKQESTRAAGRITNRLARLRGNHFNHHSNGRARREVLVRTAFHVLGVCAGNESEHLGFQAAGLANALGDAGETFEREMAAVGMGGWTICRINLNQRYLRPRHS